MYIISILDFDNIQMLINQSFARRYEVMGMKSQMVGFLFAPPHNPIAEKEIVPGLEYFYHRFDKFFDLFCVGYANKIDDASYLYPDVKSIDGLGKSWGFSNFAFNNVRKNFELITNWKYSGEADLILMTAKQKESAPYVAELDFSTALLFDLDKMIRDDAIQSVKRLFEEIARFSENTISNDPTIDFSDRKSVGIVGHSLVESALKALPDALQNFFNRGWNRGKHFQIVSLIS